MLALRRMKPTLVVSVSVDRHNHRALAHDAGRMLGVRSVSDPHRSDSVGFVICAGAQIDINSHFGQERGKPKPIDELGRLANAPSSMPSTVFVFKLRSKIALTPPIGRLWSSGGDQQQLDIRMEPSCSHFPRL